MIMMKNSKAVNKVVLFVMALMLSACSKVDFQKMETGKPYTGICQGKDCAVVFDQVAEGNVKGRAYLAGDDLVVTPIAFSSDIRNSGNGQVWIEGNQMKLKLSQKEGELQVKLGATSFSLKPQGDDTLAFKAMYMEPVSEIAKEYGRVYAHDVPGYWASYPETNEDFGTIYINKVSDLALSKDLNLDMDIYYPKVPAIRPRPLLLLIHGGAYYNGDKQAVGYPEMGQHFAERGYVVASINYRLGFKPLAADVDRAGYRGLQDANAAVRYLLANAEEFGIDTSMVFAAGTSAGAITALNLAFMREENRPECTREGGVKSGISKVVKGTFKALDWMAEKVGLHTNLDGQDVCEALGLNSDLGPIEGVNPGIPQSFKVKAVVNMWGAVHDLGMLKNSKETAVLSIHGDADRIVPYSYGYPFDQVLEPFEDDILRSIPDFMGPMVEWMLPHITDGKPLNEWAFNPMYGSSQIHDKATTMGMRSVLQTCPNGGHSLHVNDDGTLSDYFYDVILPDMTRFLGEVAVGGIVVKLGVPNGQWFEAAGTDNVAELHWQVEGGAVVGGNGSKAKVLLFGDAPKHTVAVCGKYDNGVEFRETWEEEE